MFSSSATLVFNFVVFFIRFAGVINSINTNSAWKTKTFTEEKRAFFKVIRDEFIIPIRIIEKIKKIVNTD